MLSLYRDKLRWINEIWVECNDICLIMVILLATVVTSRDMMVILAESVLNVDVNKVILAFSCSTF